MKQKYEVFINDQVLIFSESKAFKNVGDFGLDWLYSPNKLVENIKTLTEKTIIEVADVESTFAKFASQFKIIEAAGGIVRNQHGNVLMIFRLGKWDLPKGKIEKKESPEEAAIREVQEECGIDNLKILSPLESTYHVYELKGKLVLKKTYWFMMVTHDTKNLIPQQEEGIEKVEWVDFTQINERLNNTYYSIKNLLISSGLTN